MGGQKLGKFDACYKQHTMALKTAGYWLALIQGEHGKGDLYIYIYINNIYIYYNVYIYIYVDQEKTSK